MTKTDINTKTGREPKALRIKDFCHQYNVSEPTVWRYIKSGKINVVYLGNIPYITHHEQVRLGLINT